MSRYLVKKDNILRDMETVVSSKGRVLLPLILRKQDRITAGQKFDIQRLDVGRYLLKRQPVAYNGGMVDWLLACPEKNWFVEIENPFT